MTSHHSAIDYVAADISKPACCNVACDKKDNHQHASHIITRWLSYYQTHGSPSMEDKMAIEMGVFDSLVGEAKTRKKGDGPPKRYIMFETDEWHDKLEVPLGSKYPIGPSQMKEIIVNLLAKLGSGEWKLDTSGK